MKVVEPGHRAYHAIAAAALAVAASLACAPAGAADMNAVNNAGAIASSVMVGSAAPTLGIGAVLQTLVGLAVVIGLVFACAWLARRFGFQPARRGGPLKVVSSVAVGTKESATIVEIGDTWLVLGVAPGNVRLLHTLPAGSAAVTATAGSAPADAAAGGTPSDGSLPGSFGSRFRDALAGEAAKRLGRGKDR
ncbi:MAG: flagellar biosynthetic protein FliO [Burkholderia sp.]|jgi:flagellar protein FliO/FliZ|uniref:flagellar biosynthetic protein FliO n=1 Tax=Burkholderia TaxID=32008 RepID=UPI001CA45C82|nr:MULTISPECIES: flagellar biosynthetic protein FliO [Burkholderia]MBY8603963.1 flagellar biosynthetic protein FliO [Burkholderia arboris]MCA3778624.1 flagellar biosynthetic protein FliO [Burkholderia sp.]MCA3784502.1 flagellar biosynthetic protein FliO [Burkholderia sp.]MCA3797318.1 flagellar biosynthetic protein FliO [Burkholderia sp.]MCA3803730.1 flagellar biosynthetic protein FliO [Burkholderia sp.]